MAKEHGVKIRIIHKHDTEENWLKATGFTPEIAELLVVTDNPYRFKLGDGSTTADKLPYIFGHIEEADIAALFN